MTGGPGRVLPALPGIDLLLDSASAQALAPWLDARSDSTTHLGVEVRVLTAEAVRPAIVELLLEESTAWLGRTANGLIVGDHKNWLTVEGSPPVVCGTILHPLEHARVNELLVAALLVALRIDGVHTLHAAGVCINDRALVLIGDSGAGKSTTATALVSAGCRYLGDDGLLLRERSEDVELLAFSPSFRLTDDALCSFDVLRPHSSKPGNDEKWSVDVAAAFPNRQLARWLGPKTLLFLGRSGQRRSSLHALSLAQATGLLIAQSNALSLEHHPNPRQHLALLARLASRAQIARFDLGSEWLEDPLAAAQRLVEEVRSFGGPQATLICGEAS